MRYLKCSKVVCLVALILIACSGGAVFGQDEGGGGETPNPWGCPTLSGCLDRCGYRWMDCGGLGFIRTGMFPTCDEKYEACKDLCYQTECFPVY
jgi:hypothetical protein